MTRVLAIDVTGAAGGAALLSPACLLTETIPPEVRRGRDLVPGIARMLEQSGLTLDQLDVVACGVGPGSFTGIRIGVATAATLAWAAGRPVLDVGSLHGIAYNAPDDAQTVLVALDARRGNLFAARFRREGSGLVLDGAYRNAAPAEVAAELPDGAWVLGDGRAKYPDLFDRFPGAAEAPVRPDIIARIAAARFEAGERKEPHELKPLYLRKSDPEERRARNPRNP